MAGRGTCAIAAAGGCALATLLLGGAAPRAPIATMAPRRAGLAEPRSEVPAPASLPPLESSASPGAAALAGDAPTASLPTDPRVPPGAVWVAVEPYYWTPPSDTYWNDTIGVGGGVGGSFGSVFS